MQNSENQWEFPSELGEIISSCKHHPALRSPQPHHQNLTKTSTNTSEFPAGCNGNVGDTKKKHLKNPTKSTKNTYFKILSFNLIYLFCWLLNISAHPLWTHNYEKIAKDIITLV